MVARLARRKKNGVIASYTVKPGEEILDSSLRVGSAEQLDKLLDTIGEIEGVPKTTASIALSRKIDP